MKKGIRVEITWVDSKGIGGDWVHWEDVEPMPPAECMSIGYIIEETADYVTIAQSATDTQVLGTMTIPKCAITEINTLKISGREDE